MARALWVLMLLVVHATANAQTVWRALGVETQVNGSGDVLDDAGSSLVLVSTQIGKSGFSGSITSLDATAYRGRDVVISGLLQVERGAGNGAIWIRADQAGKPVNFQNTRDSPLIHQDGAQRREVRLYVPLSATRLVFGVTLDAVGSLEVASLTLRDEVASTSAASAYDVLDAALSIMGSKALNRAKVDWQAERAQLLTSDLKALPAQEAYPRIHIVLAKLGDRHSSLMTTSGVKQYRTDARPTQELEVNVLGEIGYLRLPGLMGKGPAAARAFSARVCRGLKDMAGEASSGMILDLRQNPGGNMWPMMNGLFPLLGSGDIGAFRDADGDLMPWKDRIVASCSDDMTAMPVAVLIGRGTVSSGEAVATAFKGRPGTRFFGKPSAGLSTGNRLFPLPDGSGLLLTSTVDVDRTGEAFPSGLTPDVLIDDGQDAIAIASAWLRSIDR